MQLLFQNIKEISQKTEDLGFWGRKAVFGETIILVLVSYKAFWGETIKFNNAQICLTHVITLSLATGYCNVRAAFVTAIFFSHGKLLSQLLLLFPSLVPKHGLYLAHKERARTKCQLLRDNKMEPQLCHKANALFRLTVHIWIRWKRKKKV